MALATKCPHCNTIFRVAADQLKIRGGIVRCGSCKEVFDGHAALLDNGAQRPFSASQPAQPFPTLLPEAEAGAAQIAPLATQEDASDRFEILPGLAEPGGDADFPFHRAAELEQHGAGVPELEAASQSWPMPEPQPDPWAEEAAIEAEPEWKDDGAPDAAQQQRESAFELPAKEQEKIVAVALSDYDMVEAAVAADLALPPTDAQQADDPQAEADQAENDQAEAPEAGHAQPDIALAQQDSAPPTDPIDEPGFVRQGRRRARHAKAVRILMGVGSLVLFIALLAQGVTTYRNELAAHMPQLKPTLVSVCETLGCRVELPAQIELVTIEQGELQAVAENMFSYLSVLRNKSTTAQAWPHIELILNDANDKPVLRRVLTPREYLPSPAELSEGFPPRSEQAVKLYFELAQLKASGYHIAVFYP